jgi:cytochrome c biogenesis factor
LTRDVYVILAGWDEQEQAAFRFLLYPLILWIWIGGYGMFTIGVFLHVGRTRRISGKQA